MSNLIVLKQKPIIEYDKMVERGLEVQNEIAKLNIHTLDATEENRGMMKKMRAKLNKELAVFEDQRKMIHGMITTPYTQFVDSYKDNIEPHYDSASASLKDKISDVETKLLAQKTSDLIAYFDAKQNNPLANASFNTSPQTS